MCRAGGPRCDGKHKAAGTVGAHAGAGETVTVPGNAVGSRRTGRRVTGSTPGDSGSQVNIGAVTSGGGQVHAGGDIVGEKTVNHGEKSATTGKSTVPTRDDADRLAAAYPKDAKGWDGRPLSERDRRMYALRDSGWKGPIDQDGYPTSDDTGPAAGALRRMARDRGENPDW